VIGLAEQMMHSFQSWLRPTEGDASFFFQPVTVAHASGVELVPATPSFSCRRGQGKLPAMKRGDRVMAMRGEGNWLEAEYVGPLPEDARGIEGVPLKDLSMVRFDGETDTHVTWAKPMESKSSRPGRWWARLRAPRPGA
jgi:hypothetical protein